MITISFNTKLHKLIVNTDIPSVKPYYENIITIKNNDTFYEVLQKQEDGRNAPVLRLPINETIVIFQHD
jgi:hypothetical protein